LDIENEWNKAFIVRDGLLLGFCTLKMEAVCFLKRQNFEPPHGEQSQTKTIRCSIATVKTPELQRFVWRDCKDNSSWCLGQDLNAVPFIFSDH